MSMSFEDLAVWQKGCDLTVDLYHLLKDKKEFWIRDQMLRSSLSIPSSIAEGSERGTIADFRNFINIANGSNAELRTQTHIAKRIKLIDDDSADRLVAQSSDISKMLNGLSRSLKHNRKQLTANSQQ